MRPSRGEAEAKRRNETVFTRGPGNNGPRCSRTVATNRVKTRVKDHPGRQPTNGCARTNDETSRRNRTDEQTERSNSERWCLPASDQVRSELFPDLPPSLRACLRVCARVRYNAPTATTPDILLRSSINSLLKSYQGEDLPAVGSLDPCSACLTRMITCCHRRSTFHACRETVFGLFRTTIFHSYRDDRKCTYFKEG